MTTQRSAPNLFVSCCALALLISLPQAWAENSPRDSSKEQASKKLDSREQSETSEDKAAVLPNLGFAPTEKVSPDQEVDFPADI